MTFVASRRSRFVVASGVAALLGAHAGTAHAQAAVDTTAGNGAPPADAKALVAAPKDGIKEPTVEKPTDATTVSLAAGALLNTGNSRSLAASANGAFELRRGANGFGASLLGNYSQGAKPGDGIVATAENVQGRLRYDRYLIDDMSLFLIATGRHDRFQGLDFRLNLDPGLKYLFIREEEQSLWAEAGYDFQYDVRRNDARVVLDANKNPVFNPDGTPELLDKTATDHSTRLFVGYKHAFNKEVTLSTGLEYLQSVVDVDRRRFNFDALFAAGIGGGLSLGVGFSARYDHAALPGKKDLDTATTLNLIYSYDDSAKKAEEKKEEPSCPCPDANAVNPPPPANGVASGAPPSGPAPSTAPSATPSAAPNGAITPGPTTPPGAPGSAPPPPPPAGAPGAAGGAPTPPPPPPSPAPAPSNP